MQISVLSYNQSNYQIPFLFGGGGEFQHVRVSMNFKIRKA